jgi:hypothetical protein
MMVGVIRPWPSSAQLRRQGIGIVAAALGVSRRGGRIIRFHFYEGDYTLATAFRHGGSWEVENHLGRQRIP